MEIHQKSISQNRRAEGEILFCHFLVLSWALQHQLQLWKSCLALAFGVTKLVCALWESGPHSLVEFVLLCFTSGYTLIYRTWTISPEEVLGDVKRLSTRGKWLFVATINLVHVSFSFWRVQKAPFPSPQQRLLPLWECLTLSTPCKAEGFLLQGKCLIWKRSLGLIYKNVSTWLIVRWVLKLIMCSTVLNVFPEYSNIFQLWQ